MKFNVPSTRKRPVNLTINEALVIQAKVNTNNLSVTMESLLFSPRSLTATADAWLFRWCARPYCHGIRPPRVPG